MKKIAALLIIIALALVLIICCKVKNDRKAGETDNKTTVSAESSAQSTEKTTSASAAEQSSTSTTTITTTTTASTTSEEAQAVTASAGKRDLEKFRGKKLLAITFDDGPYTPVTESLLDRLDKYDARVTFFVLGSRLDGSQSYRDTMKRAYEMGNQIGSHTYSHCDLTDLSDEALKKEVAKANSSVKNVLGFEPTAVRPPYGATSQKVENEMQKHIIMWSVDPLDWKYRNSDTVCANIVNKAFDGGIVLLHDLYQTSVDGAVKAMEKLSKQGYAFVTVDELAYLRGVQMDNSTKYYQLMPQK